MFTAQLTGHDLHAPDGTTIDGVCERSVRERVLDTIGHLDEQAALQSCIIRNALRMEPGMEDAHPTASVSSDTDAEHYPIELGTRIADTAILQETDGTVSWLTANRSDTMAADKTVDERYEPGRRLRDSTTVWPGRACSPPNCIGGHTMSAGVTCARV